jgi:hypothetical protein
MPTEKSHLNGYKPVPSKQLTDDNINNQEKVMQAIIIRGFQTQIKNPERIASYQKPSALNWRYQIPGESYQSSVKNFSTYSSPKAINWRWKLEK